MGILSSLFGKKVNGYIRAYELEDWWNNSFTVEQQKYITNKYQPLGGRENMLTEGDINVSGEPKTLFLANLATWFNTKKDLEIARKIIIEAEKSFGNMSFMKQHYYFLTLIKHYYLDRENPESFDAAIRACENQISISKKVKHEFKKDGDILPSHTGFQQLAIIEEKRKNYKRAIDLSKQALKEGWSGDWEKRIERLENKVNK